MKTTLIALAALILATTAHADQADDTAMLMQCAAGSEDPQACIGTIAYACLETAAVPEEVEACYTRETVAWRYPAEGLYGTALAKLAAIADDLPDLLERSQEGWEDYAYAHCRMTGLSDPDIARQPITEANCAMKMNANRIIELMALGQP